MAIVLVLGGGAAAGWKLLGHQSARPTAGPHASTGTAGLPSASAATATPAGTASQASPVSGAQNGGQHVVAVAPAVSQLTGAPQIAAFLQTYFQAINNRDYGSYSALFEPRLRPTLQQFESGYATTRDSGAMLSGISPMAGGLAAAVSFASHQQPADSPTGTSCTSWNITLYLKPHGSTYWIVHPPAGYHAHYQAC